MDRRLVYAVLAFLFTMTVGTEKTAQAVSSAPLDNLATGLTMQGNLPLTGIYKFKDDIKIRPRAFVLEGITRANVNSAEFSFFKDEPIAVKFDAASDQAILTLLLAPEEDGYTPEMIIVSREELLAAGLTYFGEGDKDTLYAEHSPYDQTQVADTKVRTGVARQHYNGPRNCVAFTKWKIGWGNRPLGSGPAGVSTLAAAGWSVRVGRAKCESAPRGTVGTWSPAKGYNRPHTAVWTGSCWEFDMGCFDPGKKYAFAKCAVPPGKSGRRK